MRIECEREPEKEVEEFFQEFFRNNDWDKQASHMLAIFLAVIQVLFMLFPVQSYFLEDADKVDYVMGYVIILSGIYAAYLYLLPYIGFKEKQQRCRFYDKLRYIPIEVSALRNWRIRYLLRFQIKVFLCCMVAQLSFTAIIKYHISWENFVYVLIMGFMLPFVVNLLLICHEK